MELRKFIPLILTCTALPALAQYCPTNWVQFQSKCYMFTIDKLRFATCSSTCSASYNGATMLCIENIDQNNFVQSKFTSGSTLIGYSRDSNGQFVWFPGCVSSFTNWFPQEPNNMIGIENYVELYHDSGQWNDTYDGAGLYCACELDVGDTSSTHPNGQPSYQPSGQPSNQPSALSSHQPLLQPAQETSSRPSLQPSSQPSNQPSNQPSGQPTAPTMEPTPSPTAVATTAKPTSRPTPRVESTPMRPKVPPFTQLYDCANTPATRRQQFTEGSFKSASSAGTRDDIKSKINKMREKVAVMRGEL
jgi:hypothetical protein